MTPFKFIVLAVLVPTCMLGQSPQVLQEDFDGTSLGPAWEAYPLQGSISVSGGKVHLTLQPVGLQLLQFPCVRVQPNAGIVPSPIWIVETKLNWLITPPLQSTFNGTTHFAAAHAPVPATLGCASGQSFMVWDCPVYLGYADPGGLTAKAGSAQMPIAIDSAPHTYRWLCDGVTVAFYLDSVYVFSGNYQGSQPNNFVLGSHCGMGANKWNGLEVDQIRVQWGQILDGPATASVGTAINYALALTPVTSYMLDVSVSGTYPGVVYGPANLIVPLNPPFLNQDFGTLLPGVFVNFMGTSDSSGRASATVNVPFELSLIGTPISAAYVALDALAPGGVSGVAQPVTTTIMP